MLLTALDSIMYYVSSHLSDMCFWPSKGCQPNGLWWSCQLSATSARGLLSFIPRAYIASASPGTPSVLPGLLLLHPLEKMTKSDARGPDRVEIYREIVPGLELAANRQRALDRAGSYPNSNHRPVVSDVSLFR